MKRFIVAVIRVGVVVAGLGWRLNRPTVPAAAPTEPVAEIAPASAGDAPQPVQPVAAQPEQPVQRLAAPRVASATSFTAPSSINPALDSLFLSRTIDVLVSPQVRYQQKTAARKQLATQASSIKRSPNWKSKRPPTRAAPTTRPPRPCLIRAAQEARWAKAETTEKA